MAQTLQWMVTLLRYHNILTNFNSFKAPQSSFDGDLLVSGSLGSSSAGNTIHLSLTGPPLVFSNGVLVAPK